MTSTVKISGMSCNHCVAAVKSALKDLPGIKSLEVKVGEAVIETEGALDVEAVKNAIAEAGYEVVSIS
ncbi:MAG TPA: cation transporter [Symbiobacteriaceae bacterium]